jgi:pimeloyl-ACP methyl ester carboxylesterase
MQEHNLQLNGKNVFYRASGQGPAVVLVHGFAEDGSVWQHQYGVLEDCRLIVPDLPGSGRSELIEDVSMEALADWLHQLTQAIELGPFFLIGHSMGGYVALAFAERYPEALSGLGLFHSTAYPDTEEKKQTRRKGIAFMEQNGAFEFLKTATPNLYSPFTKANHPELISTQLEAIKDFSAGSLIAYYRAMMERPDRTAVLRSITVPVLFILGRSDAAVPLADGLKQCHLPLLSSVHILENSGHMGMQEETAKANQALLDWNH